MKVVVLGGVAAGTKIAAKLMREDRANEVIVLNKGKNISYAGCGLPYYVGHVIEEREQLIVNTPEKYAKLTGVTVMTETEATKVDPEAKKVTAVNHVLPYPAQRCGFPAASGSLQSPIQCSLRQLPPRALHLQRLPLHGF